MHTYIYIYIYTCLLFGSSEIATPRACALVDALTEAAADYCYLILLLFTIKV